MQNIFFLIFLFILFLFFYFTTYVHPWRIYVELDAKYFAKYIQVYKVKWLSKQLDSQKLTNGKIEVLEKLHGAQREGVMGRRFITLIGTNHHHSL